MVDQSPWVMLTPAQAAAVDRLRAELEAAKLPRTCVWAEDPDGVWEGSCGMMWNLESGTPAENDMNYCPRCGAKLEQAKETLDAT